MIVQMLKNKEVLQDTSLLSNRYDNKSTNIKINLLDEFISEDYFYYLVCKSPDKSAIQFAIPLVLDVETKSLTFIVKSNITNTIGNWEFCLLIKELAIVDGVINDDGLIAVSEYFVGKVKPGIINENEIGEQPLEEPLQIIYDRLLATEADIKDNENARKVFEEFNIAKSYVIGNKVAYLGSSYVCIADCTGILPTDTTKWLLIAKKGEQGIQGLPGNDGYTPIKNIDYFDGEKGDTGDNAYQVWLSQGNIGTVADYLLSLKGDTGAKGDKPNHQWTGTSLQMENPDGSWGVPVDLKGEPGAGVGDMTKTVYDTNNDGKVDKADDSDKLGSQGPAYYAKQEDVGDKTTLTTTDKTNLVAAINEVKEQNNTLDAQKAKQTDLETEIANRTSAVATEKAERQAEVAVERARINSFTALPEGSTTGDAELIDARVGGDGVTYDNAGGAIRGQFVALKSDLNELENIAITQTKNLANIDEVQIGKVWNTSSNVDRASLYIEVLPNTSYTISFGVHVFDAIYYYEKTSADATTSVYSTSITSGYTRITSSTTGVIVIGFNKIGISLNDFIGLNLQVEKGTVATPYIANVCANDVVVRSQSITYVTPEMYGAYGDGVHNDVVAFQKALDSGKNVVANGVYLISTSLHMASEYGKGQKLDFNEIIYTGTAYALQISGRNGKVVGNFINSNNGGCVSIGENGLTYQWHINISMLQSPNGRCYKLGGLEPVSECTIMGERCQYGVVGVYFDLANYWVGQITFMNMNFNTANPTAAYAFFANGALHPLTGLTLYNISLEGSHGGFEFVNSQPSAPIETLNCFGLRTSEMSIRDGYNVIRYTGAGIIRGKMILDVCNLSSFDFTNAVENILLSPCFTVEGRIISKGQTWNRAEIIHNELVPHLITTTETVNNPVFTSSNLPNSHCIITGTTATLTIDYVFIGSFLLIGGNDNISITINGHSFTINTNDTIKVESVKGVSTNKLLITVGNKTYAYDL